MRTTEARIFCGRDSDGPIILIGGTRNRWEGWTETVQYFQNPGPWKQGRYDHWEGRIRVDSLHDGSIQEATKEECADLIARFFPGVQVKYCTLAEALA